MIRYRSRDLTRLLPGTARSMRRMEKVTGRSDDMIILRGVNVFPTQIEEQVLAVSSLAPYFQIELSKEGPMNQMKVLVESHPDSSLAEDKEASSRVLAMKIKETVGISVSIRVGDPGSVERSQGKARRVVDLRPKE